MYPNDGFGKFFLSVQNLATVLASMQRACDGQGGSSNAPPVGELWVVQLSTRNVLANQCFALISKSHEISKGASVSSATRGDISSSMS